MSILNKRYKIAPQMKNYDILSCSYRPYMMFFNKENFKSNPRQVLNDNGVFLPDDMILEFQKPNSDRPKIIVYEKKKDSNFKIRVVQLQLVMLAGR